MLCCSTKWQQNCCYGIVLLRGACRNAPLEPKIVLLLINFEFDSMTRCYFIYLQVQRCSSLISRVL